MSIPPLAAFAISTGVEVVKAATNIRAEEEQRALQEEQNKIAEAEARTAMNLDIDQLMLRGSQEQAAAEQSQFEAQLDALQATERAAVSAGESGVEGLSVDALIADMWGRNARFNDSVDQNFDGVKRQLEFEGRNTGANYQRTVNGLTPADRPNYALHTLNAVSGIGSSYRKNFIIE
jgi:hypothetical protein